MTNHPPITHPILDEDYPTLFRQHVLRSVQAVLVRARREATPGLSEAGRTRIFAVLDYALRLADAWSTVRELLRVLSPQFNLGGYWMQWLPYLERSIATSITQGDEEMKATLIAEVGLLHQRLNRLDSAEIYLKQATQLARQQGNPALLGLVLQRQAEVERLHRHYAECSALLDEAQALFIANDPAQAYGLFIRGKAALDQHDLVAANSALTEALRLWQAENDQARAALCIQNLGRIAASQGELSAAISLYKQALDLLNETSNRSNIPVVQLNLGNVYYAQQQYEQAMSLYQEAETSLLSMSDDRYLAMAYNNVGLVYTVWGEWREAEVNLQRSLALHQQIGDKKAWINTQGNLGIAYLEEARYDQAITTFQAALAELQTTPHDPEYERLWNELTKYLTQAQEHR